MNYVPRTIPRAHQLKALELTRGKKVFAYLCEMGTGKSKMVLDEWATRVTAGTVHDLLIIAPAGSYSNWCIDKTEIEQSQIRAHLSEEMFKRIVHFTWRSGQGKLALRNLEWFLKIQNRPRIFAVNIEALSRDTGAMAACRRFLIAPERRSMTVVDESTTIRNDSERTREVMKLKDITDLRRILTGLVTPKSPEDLFYQFEFLDLRILGHTSAISFQHRYCVLNKIKVHAGIGKDGKPRKRNINVVVAHRNLEELNGKIAPYSYRVLKKDCLDLPPKIYAPIRDVPLTEEQRRIYNELIEFATAELSAARHVTATMVVTQLLRLHQIVCGHSVDDQTKEEIDIKSNRISSMMELLEEHDGKAIIWSNYRREIEKIVAALEERYGERSVAQFHGGNKTSRLGQEARFLSSPDCRFMVSTQSAGSRGNTWVVANLVVYFSNNFDLEMRMQSEDRAHRDGLKHSVTYVDFVARGTIDEKILSALRKKLNMATLISGENYREWLI